MTPRLGTVFFITLGCVLPGGCGRGEPREPHPRLTVNAGEIVLAIAFSPDGRTLASGGGRAVRLWDTATGEERGALYGHDQEVCALAFSPDGRTLASGCWSHAEFIDGTPHGDIRLWDVTDRRGTVVLAPNAGRVNSVAFSPDGGTLASDGPPPSLWDVRTGTRGRSFPDSRCLCMAFSPDGGTLAVGDASTIHLHPVVGGDPVTPKLPAGFQQPRSLAFSPDGRVVAVGGQEGAIALVDRASGRVESVLRGHEGNIVSVAFTPGGTRLVSGSASDRSVTVWDVATGQSVTTFRGHGDAVYSVALSPDGKTVASAGRDQHIRLWDMPGEQAK